MTGLVPHHRKGPSTTFRPQGSTIAGFFEIGKLSTCGFVFVNSGMVEGGRFNVVDGHVSWQTVRLETHGDQPRMAIPEVAVEYGLNWHLKGKNTPYFTATYRGDGF